MNLHIPITIWQRLRLYTELSLPNEVTGIGTIEVQGPDDVVVREVFLPRQKTSPGVCEFADGELNRIIYELIERDDASYSGASQLRFRWHSHALGNVFWSTKDEDDINDWDASWVVNLVMNVHGDHLARLDYFQPLHVHNHPVTLVIDYPEDPALRVACLQEIRERLTVMPLVKSPIVKEVIPDGLFGSTPHL